MRRRSESRCRRTRRAIRPGSRSRSRHANRRPTGPRSRRRRRSPHRSRRAAAPARARARVRAQPARGADSCCRARATFENLIRHLVRRPVRVDHDDAGNASQPLSLVGGVAASSPHDRLDCVVAWQLQRPRAGRSPAARSSRAPPPARGEPRPPPRPRTSPPSARRSAARASSFATSRPTTSVGWRISFVQSRSRAGRSDAPTSASSSAADDAAAVVRVQSSCRLGIERGQPGVRRLSPAFVVERAPALPRPR